MASNFVEKNYVDTTPAPQLSRKTLNKMVYRSMFLQSSFNFERMQANGWLFGILPGLEEIHTNKEDLSTSMTHNLEFFNTHPFLVNLVMGIILSMEQQKVDVNTIRSVRVATMGPLGGIGDALFWFTLIPITAGITANLAIDGNFAAPFIFLAVVLGVQMALRFFLMHWSYRLGTTAMDVLTENAREFTRAASILGVFIVGALTSNFGGTTVALEYVQGDKVINVQSILDGVLPKLIPLTLTLLLYFLFTKKKWKPTHGILLMLFIGIFGAFVGIF